MADSALLLRGWEQWQDDVVLHLEGPFAFAVWDSRQRRLFLARDHLGLRPLHYHHGDGWFAFASMPKGLLALPQVPTGPDLQFLAETLAGLPDTGTRSFFAGVERLEPGHVAWLCPDGRLQRRPYWEPEAIAVSQSTNPADYVEALRESFDRSVAAHLRAAGPIASQLSSGYDSTAVTVTAARQLALRGQGLDAFTFSPIPGFKATLSPRLLGDEAAAAAATAALHPNIRHHVEVMGPDDDFTRLFQPLHYAMDRPIINALNMRWICRTIQGAQKVGARVLLTGGFGNFTISFDGKLAMAEYLANGRLWAACRLYRQLRRVGKVPHSILLRSMVGPFLPAWGWRLAYGLAGKCLVELTDDRPISPQRLALPEMRAAMGRWGLDSRQRGRRDERKTRLMILKFLDSSLFDKGYLGLYGVDVRDPTLSLGVVRTCMSVPSAAWCGDGRLRAPFRLAFADRVPDHILNARLKGYQSADWYEALQVARPALNDMLPRLLERPDVAEVVDAPGLGRLLAELDDPSLLTTPLTNPYRCKLARGAATADFIRRASGGNI